MFSLALLMGFLSLSLRLPLLVQGVAACGGCSAGGDGASLGDELSLLQAEVKKSSKAPAAGKVPGSATAAHADEAEVALSTCSLGDDTAALATCGGAGVSPQLAGLALREFESLSLPRDHKGDAALTAAAPAAVGADAAAAPAKPSKEDASAAVLVVRLVLLVSTVMILADGCKRTLQSSRGCKAAAAAAPAGARAKQAPAAGSAPSHADLMQAALAGDTARCEALIKQGAETQGRDIWGSTPLHAAASSGSAELLSKLLQLGLGAELEARDAWAETPLHVGARAGHLEACEVLLAFGADIDALNQQGYTPLVLAGHEGQESICDMLRGHGAGTGELAEEELPLLLRQPAFDEAEGEGADKSTAPGLDEDELMAEAPWGHGSELELSSAAGA